MKSTIAKFTFLIISIVVGMCDYGCTRNNGDIGVWFGQWQLERIDINGQCQTDYPQNIFFSFQNNVVRAQLVSAGGYNELVKQCYGTWSQPSENTLIMDFSQTDDTGKLIYNLFPESHLPDGQAITFTILELNHSKAILKYLPTDGGDEIVYTLQKRG